ncbi:MAG: GNAT family N-acetyltransferase [Devosiaceae bacterium]|nr:GNAT family N-acetyltransferase [Devosiaceae bacterium MH13]
MTVQTSRTLVARAWAPATAPVDGDRHLGANALEPNIFFEPAVLEPALALLAPRAVTRTTSLDGAGSLAAMAPMVRLRGRYGPLPVPVPLGTWLHDYSPLGTPLVSAGDAEAALGQLLADVAAAHPGPPVVLLQMVAKDGPFWQLLLGHLSKQGLRATVIDETDRAGLRLATPVPATLRSLISKRSAHSIRTARKRLRRRGEPGFESAQSLSELSAALDTFLALEAAGWKGAHGTALQTIGHDGFFRTAVMNLGAERRARIDATTLDGSVVASTVWIRNADEQRTIWMPWKTTYDEAYRNAAPGSINLYDATEALLAEAARAQTALRIDSLAATDSVIAARLWQHRRHFCDILIDLDPAGSAAFSAIALAERTRKGLRTRAKNIRDGLQRMRKAKR